ncbi:DUF6456 domain-containing protein [Loktanella sp. SALINAS62]|uniref:DUF6456 domain-containing protein n=1 Tax=Loktanella sp. SALINAS62 TaxID=2706124 RepID=UPI001B8CB629|nr:DUF6456 domain-containing protein [Loktanella sp. SALINAS62]MBS1303632.1 helix-turn-helix domain containing protein [Loktanella sp. SALINAS62]
MEMQRKGGFSDWVPPPVRDYLAHTVDGRSIRALARQRKVHPSTILRQVRSCEARRDDPLIDAALRALVETDAAPDIQLNQKAGPMTSVNPASAFDLSRPVSKARIDREAVHILRRLCEPGAVMAVARDMDSAVIVREDREGKALKTAIVESDMAQAMALQNWISCADPAARVVRYFVTAAGRAELRRLTARDENRAQGFSDATAGQGDWIAANGCQVASRFIATETPLMGLSRRRDKAGKPFLSRELVQAGERLREDFVVADAGPDVLDDWRLALAVRPHKPMARGAVLARQRVGDALDDLGPGLQDAVLRCCCLLEGLEVTERAMGWSARSGKIVLRIALQRLLRHYDSQKGMQPPMIG